MMLTILIISAVVAWFLGDCYKDTLHSFLETRTQALQDWEKYIDRLSESAQQIPANQPSKSFENLHMEFQKEIAMFNDQHLKDLKTISFLISGMIFNTVYGLTVVLMFLFLPTEPMIEKFTEHPMVLTCILSFVGFFGIKYYLIPYKHMETIDDYKRYTHL